MRQYPSRHATATTTTETYYAIDPTLECYHPPTQPRPPFTAYDQDHEGCRRDFSTATFIDHGSPPASPIPSFAPPHVVNTDETVLYATRGHGHGHGHGGGGFASLGLTKEEWLRLGGFLNAGEEGDLSIQLPLPSFPPDLRENVPAVVPNRSANDDDDDNTREQVALPIPPPLRLPSPTPDVVAAASPTPTPTVLGGPLRLPPAHLPASMIPPALPLPAPRALPPPVQFSDAFLEQQQQQQPALRTPTRSQRRRAPSPIQAVRAAARPAPYPPTVTVSQSGRDEAVADDDHATGDIAVVEAPPPSLLTPIRAALAKYPEIPLPAVPPSPLPPPPGKKKKRHGRKMSADHIPRPRNAFILFRSHAITSGLIPRSIGVKDHKNISQIVGGVWRGLSEVERQQWEELAEEEKRRHLAKYPNYAYRPKQTDKPRAAPGYGKKARAKAARLAAEYAELTGTDLEEAERYCLAQQQHQHANIWSGTNNSSTTSGDDNGSSASFLLPPPPLPQDVLHKRREERRMALIAQALLEGEQDDRVLQRVELQLEAEMGPAPAVAAPEPPTSREEDIPVVGNLPAPSLPAALGKKAKAKTTLATPPPPSRRTRSSSARGAANEDETTPTKQQQPPSSSKRAMYASLAGGGSVSDSTQTQTQLSPSPFHRSAVSPASPSSSDSPAPSPLRMQSMPMSRGGGGGSSSSTGRGSRKHPLSRSQSATTPEEMEEADGGDYASDDLPAARRQKTSSYSVLGVSSATAADPTSGYMFPPTRHSGSATTDVPLFAGPTDSRNFSLGRWELRKPSAAVTSRREMLARQVEEQEQEKQQEEEKGAWVNSATEATIAPSPFLLNSSEFLFEAGLEPPPPPPPTRGGATGLVDPRATVLQPPLASSSYACAASGTDPHDDDGSTEYGTAYSSSSVFDTSWQSDAASSSVYYDTAPSSSSAWSARSPNRMTMPPAAAETSGSLASKDPYGLFRPQPVWSATSVGPSLFAAQQQHNNNNNHGYFAPESGGAGLGYEPLSATATAGGGASPGGEEDLFHFGAEDLFAQPPPALSLFEHDPSARTISSMFDPTSPGAGIGDERLGLGIAL